MEAGGQGDREFWMNRVSRGRIIWLLAHRLASDSTREMENISRGPTFEDFVTDLCIVLQYYRVEE
jgi:hypothetical protein